jgi:hypothetical protein
MLSIVTEERLLGLQNEIEVMEVDFTGCVS